MEKVYAPPRFSMFVNVENYHMNLARRLPNLQLLVNSSKVGFYKSGYLGTAAQFLVFGS